MVALGVDGKARGQKTNASSSGTGRVGHQEQAGQAQEGPEEQGDVLTKVILSSFHFFLGADSLR